MQTTALEEKIKQLSADYIYEQAVGSLLLMLMSAMEDVEKGDAPLPYTIHEDLLAIKKDIRSYLLSLEDILEGEQEDRAAALEACLAKKKNCYPSMKPFTATSPSGISTPHWSAIKLPCANIKKKASK